MSQGIRCRMTLPTTEQGADVPPRGLGPLGSDDSRGSYGLRPRAAKDSPKSHINHCALSMTEIVENATYWIHPDVTKMP